MLAFEESSKKARESTLALLLTYTCWLSVGTEMYVILI